MYSQTFENVFNVESIWHAHSDNLKPMKNLTPICRAFKSMR